MKKLPSSVPPIVTLARAVALSFTVGALPLAAEAADNIVRPWQGIRSSAMGGVRLTTGLYDENFHSNPARTAANPTWRVQLPVTVDAEVGTQLIDNASTVIDAAGAETSELLGTVLGLTGTQNHARVQTLFPGVYVPGVMFGETPVSFAFGVLTSTQLDLAVRRNFNPDLQAINDVSSHFTVAAQFLDMNELAIGLDTHVDHRVSTNQLVLADLFSFLGDTTNIEFGNFVGAGAHLEFDLGATYVLPWHPLDWDFEVAGSVNNFLGGTYDNLGFSILTAGNLPRAQPRSFGFGFAVRPDFFTTEPFEDTVLAFEITDLGNNTNGSFFRTVHLGFETRLLFLLPRAGINQGYWTAGLGLDLKVLTLDFSTYGEEMGLNAGVSESRRYQARLAFQI